MSAIDIGAIEKEARKEITPVAGVPTDRRSNSTARVLRVTS